MLSSFYFPYWEMKLKAPQYPKGLRLTVFLDRVEGDTREINIINHYIGMGKIDSAAKFERKVAWYAILGLVMGGILCFSLGFKIRRIYYLPPILFLVGFVTDFVYWMYKFGHTLNPNSPITFIKPFMPTVLGQGKIGQFSTVSYFGPGFWMAMVASACFIFALSKKRLECQDCEHYHNCKVLCDRGYIARTLK